LDERVKIHFCKRRQGVDYLYPLKLAALLRREKTQILHLHNSTAFFYGVIAGKMARVPVIVYTEHARDVIPNMKVRVADRILSSFVDQVVVVAEFLKENLIQREWFNSSKIMTIYNGIDEGIFKKRSEARDLRQKLRISPDTPAIGIIGRLDPIKNHRCLIRAMKRVVECFPGSVLLIAGDGPFRDELNLYVKRLKLGRNVFFLGTRSDVPDLLTIMDVFVLCSFSEGMPMTLLEAMATGKPIVATSIGGIPEVIEDGENGLLVESDDHESLAGAIVDLLGNHDKAKRIGSAARLSYENNFTLDSMVNKYEQVYTSLYEST
jgi:glycosyltransferase involved in cell wall biosynthesis